MLIDGQPVGADVLGQLSQLKSSFPDIRQSQSLYEPTLEDCALYNEAYSHLSQGQTAEALDKFRAVEKTIPKDQPNNLFLASTYLCISLDTPDLQEKILNTEKALPIYLEIKDYGTVEKGCKMLAAAHKENGTFDKYREDSEKLLEQVLKGGTQDQELNARLALGAIYRTEGKHEKAFENYTIAYNLQQGVVDYKAVRVEQHEVGFSDQKIGTDNILQCVAVILHDPITKKTALAHVDKFTDAKSLTDVIKHFPEGTKLDAYLTGGRDRSQEEVSVSDANIAKVVAELAKHDTVNIKSADVGDKGSPSGIVFDPQTAELKHAVPGNHHETTNARKLLYEIDQNLNFAFDLTQSPEIKGPAFEDIDKKLLVQRYFNTPKLNESVSEVQNANLIYDPLCKVVEKIRAEDPEIFYVAIKQEIEKKLKTEQFVDAIQKAEVTDSLLSKLEGSFQDGSKSLLKIEQEIEQVMSKTSVASEILGSFLTKFEEPFQDNSKNSPQIEQETAKKEDKNFFERAGESVLDAAKAFGKLISDGCTAIGKHIQKTWQNFTKKEEPQIKGEQNNSQGITEIQKKDTINQQPEQLQPQSKGQETDKPNYSVEATRRTEQLRGRLETGVRSNSSNSTPINKNLQQQQDSNRGM